MSYAQDAEARLLRRSEAEMQSASEEADRLLQRLLPRYACNFVIAESIPFMQWCRLPWDWQNGVNGPVTLVRGKPSVALRGPVGVSLATLRWLADDPSNS